MGGAQRHLVSFLPAISRIKGKTGCRVLVRESCPIEPIAGIELHPVPDRYAAVGSARLWFDAVEVPRLMRQHHTDALVSLMNIGPVHVNVPHIILQRNALLFSREHMSLFPPRQILKFRFQRFLAVAAMRRAHRVITPSAAMANLIQKDCPDLPQDRFFVLPHALDPNAYSGKLDPKTSLLLRRPGAKLLYSSLAGPHKGLSLLLQIVKSLPHSFPATVYVTGGDEGGLLIENIRSNAKAFGIEDRIVFLGRIRRIKWGRSIRHVTCYCMFHLSSRLDSPSSRHWRFAYLLSQ